MLTDVVHAVDSVVHDLVALVGNRHRTLGNLRRLISMGGHPVDGFGHVADSQRRLGDLLSLMFRGLG
ncbi:hypothetical protein D3C81_1172840 [compost metagenome]